MPIEKNKPHSYVAYKDWILTLHHIYYSEEVYIMGLLTHFKGIVR